MILAKLKEEKKPPKLEKKKKKINTSFIFRHCALCKRYVSAENRHCKQCQACTSKDGSTYRHCNKCKRCVKPCEYLNTVQVKILIYKG